MLAVLKSANGGIRDRKTETRRKVPTDEITVAMFKEKHIGAKKLQELQEPVQSALTPPSNSPNPALQQLRRPRWAPSLFTNASFSGSPAGGAAARRADAGRDGAAARAEALRARQTAGLVVGRAAPPAVRLTWSVLQPPREPARRPPRRLIHHRGRRTTPRSRTGGAPVQYTTVTTTARCEVHYRTRNDLSRIE